ncbi:hypothetical protein CHARACLAT_025774, partial [Characodon lateralis]|nr:hypothetical protein [Characodon lateralis]
IPQTHSLSERVAHKGMAQFQEMMRQQLESSMDTELEKLVDTVSGTDRDVRRHPVFIPPFLSLSLSDHLVVI